MHGQTGSRPPNGSRAAAGATSGSVASAFALLDELCHERGGNRLSALARQVGIPKTSALRILSTLCELGVVRHDAATHLYWPGSRLLDYGRAQLGIGHDIVTAFNEIATPVNAKLGETMQLAVLTGTDVTFLARLDSSRPVRLVTQVGRRLPAHATAAGKAILAFAPASAARDVLKPGLVRLTERTITDPKQFMAVLEQAKVDGYACEVEESAGDLSCFAAPVFGADGQVCAGLTLCIPTADVAAERARRLIDTACDTAGRMSALLGAGSQAGVL